MPVFCCDLVIVPTTVDLDAVTHTLLGGLLTYILPNLVLVREEAQPPTPDRADAVVEIIMRALTS